MPRRLRRVRHARARTVTRSMLEYLELGHNYFGDGFGPDPDVDEMRAVWKEHRAALLAEARPGLRPWGWWEFESPEPRAPAISAGAGWWLEGLREHQTLQLLRMDEIGEIELLELQRSWAVYDDYATTAARRQHLGIPEWWNSSEFDRSRAATEHSEA